MNHPTLALLMAVLAASCAETPQRFDVPPPRIAGQSQAAYATEDEAPPSETVSAKGETGSGAEMVRLTSPPRGRASLQSFDWSGRFPDNDSVMAAVEAVSLRDFIKYSFADVLKSSFVIAEDLPGLDEPVTLSLEKPVSSRAYYRLVTEMLNSRKISTAFKEGVFYLYPTSGKALGTIPIGLGNRPQDVPNVPGVVMQIVPLRYGLNQGIEKTIVDLVTVQVRSDQQQSALFVTGEREAVLRALDVVSLLDQPANRAREVAIVTLSYMGSREAADQLVTLLANEGVVAGVGRADGMNVALVPLEQLGALVVFAGGAELLQRVEYWVKQLDRPNQGPAERYFVYHPRHARASDLAESLAPLLGGTILQQPGSLSRDTRSALGPLVTSEVPASSSRVRGSAVGNQAMAGAAPGSGQFVTEQNVLRRDVVRDSDKTQPISIQGADITLAVDPRSNSLIFYTTGERYQALLPMVRRLDVPPKQVLLETTIAEVTLSGEFAHGVEFAFTDDKISGGTFGNLGLPDGGLALNYFANITQQVRIKLSETNSLVNVLSNPTLVVRDGVQASIMVGNDVPTVGATATDPIVSDTQITQILYRRTGLNLKIRPTINAQGLVVMEIEQSISNEVPGASDVQGSPTFFERAVTTEVVARSGQSILLAGLISERNTNNSAKVPWIGDVPALGWLFRSDSKAKDRTELVILITPRVIDDPSEWARVRVGMQEAYTHLRLPPDTYQEGAAGSSVVPAPTCLDIDRDGNCDAPGRCSQALTFANAYALGCEAGEFLVEGVSFGLGSTALTVADKQALEPVAVMLRERASLAAEVNGFSDGLGDLQQQASVAQSRADAVRDYLVSRGIAVERLVTLGHATAGPAAIVAKDGHRVENKHITIELIGHLP